MSWNYRIIKSQYKLKDIKGDYYAVHEVYYDESMNPTGWSENPIYLAAENPTEIKDDMLIIGMAFKRPILEEKNGKLIEISSELKMGNKEK